MPAMILQAILFLGVLLIATSFVWRLATRNYLWAICVPDCAQSVKASCASGMRLIARSRRRCSARFRIMNAR